jgi:riboflavin transporter FmnP
MRSADYQILPQNLWFYLLQIPLFTTILCQTLRTGYAVKAVNKIAKLLTSGMSVAPYGRLT